MPYQAMKWTAIATLLVVTGGILILAPAALPAFRLGGLIASFLVALSLASLKPRRVISISSITDRAAAGELPGRRFHD